MGSTQPVGIGDPIVDRALYRNAQRAAFPNFRPAFRPLWDDEFDGDPQAEDRNEWDR